MDDGNSGEQDPLEKLARLAARVARSSAASAVFALASLGVSSYELLTQSPFGEISKLVLGLVLGGAVCYFALDTFASRFASLSLRMRLRGLEVTISRLRASGRESAAKELAVSVSYLDSVKSRNLRAKVVLMLCSAVLLVIAFRFPDLQLIEPALVSSAVLGLLFLKEAVLEYRIRHGLFGTNRTEARDLIEFLVQNSEDIDFTDGGGKLRRVLFPEKAPSGGRDVRAPQGGATA